MNEQDRLKLINLTENQAQMLKTVFTHKAPASGASGLSGQGLGRIVTTLRDAGFITQMGRKGRQSKWIPTPLWEDNWDKYRKEISAILDRIVV